MRDIRNMSLALCCLFVLYGCDGGSHSDIRDKVDRTLDGGVTTESSQTQETTTADESTAIPSTANPTQTTTIDSGTSDTSASPETVSTPTLSWYKPEVSTSWEIQLTGTLNTSYPARLYDIDLFDTSAQKIAELKGQGHKVICYFSAGSYEDWRPDASDFPESALGNELDGWPGERWLDIRSKEVWAIMQRRMDLAVQKGCDGVDPDNVDGYTNNTGFPLTSNDQLAYNSFLAQEAHKRGLSVGLKNDLSQIDSLVGLFDFSINEECHAYDECDRLMPFIAQNKPVFNIEYDISSDEQAALCADARARNFRTLIMPDNLDGSFRISCDD